MANIKIPDILTDLAHVGTAGLLLGNNPAINHELDLCRQWGYRLDQDDDRVCLHFDDDQVVPYWIQRETPNLAWEGLRVNGYLQIDSTNREAILQARRGVPAGTLICSEEQTEGRGREDRRWFSPANSGLYFSLVVRPEQKQKYWPLLTHVASIALVHTLHDLLDSTTAQSSSDIDIKWPNDVQISGKKCAGILLQTVKESENQAVIVGVGIDVRPESVPEEMSQDAISIDEAANRKVPRRKILVGFLHHFQKVYISFENGRHAEILDIWKHHSTMWDGVNVWIEEGGRRRSVKTCGLNEMGALIVQNESGIKETILTGSIRIQAAT